MCVRSEGCRYQQLCIVRTPPAVTNCCFRGPLAVARRCSLSRVPFGQPHLVGFLRKSFVSPRGAADVWVDMAVVNTTIQDWTSVRFVVDTSGADALLERKWRLPQRAPRSSVTVAGDMATADEGVGAPSARGKTMGYKYLHRAVSHFYQSLGNKAVSAFATFVNNEEEIGSFRRVRGTRTKYEVFFSPGEAVPMLADDSFMTEFPYRAGIIRALEVVFSITGVLDRYTEAGPVPGGSTGVCCLLAHVAFVTMKIRAHLKKRAATDPNGEDGDDGPPVLNGGHRAEWVEELASVRQAFAVQGARPSNGLRITDGSDPRCTDPAHPRPPSPTQAVASGPPVTGAHPTTNAVLQTPAAGANRSSTDDADGEDPSDGDTVGPVEQAAIDTAHAAVAHAM